MRQVWSAVCLCMVVAVCSAVAGSSLSSRSGTDLPELVRLDSLSGPYGEVRFDHSLHVSYASCAECHHHLAGRPSTDPVCSGCHPSGSSGAVIRCRSCHLANRFSADRLSADRGQPRYHIDVVGLLGAYHINCLGCHLSLTAGPTGCLECHRRNGGDAASRDVFAGRDEHME